MSKATLQFCINKARREMDAHMATRPPLNPSPRPYEDVCFTLDRRGKLVIYGNEYRIMFLAKGRWWFWHQWAKVYALPRYRSIGHGKRVRIGYGALEWMLKHLHSEEFRDKRRRMMRPITLRIVPTTPHPRHNYEAPEASAFTIHADAPCAGRQPR